jgi:hypothetical protein
MRAKRPGQSPLLLLDVIDVLAREQFDYVVVGALAAAVHGNIRARGVADALVPATAARLGRLVRAFTQMGLTAELRRGDPDDPVQALLLVGDAFGNRVDLLGGLRGLDADTLSRAVEIPFAGSSIRVAGREDFIAMKCFAGAPQDLEDARVALQSAGAVDLDLLRRVTRRFGRAAADQLELLLSR